MMSGSNTFFVLKDDKFVQNEAKVKYTFGNYCLQFTIDVMPSPDEPYPT